MFRCDDKTRQEIKCSRIVAFGDSLTAGSETLDYTQPWNELKKKGQEYFFKKISQNSDLIKDMDQHHENQKLVSWPNQLAKILNLHVANYAVGGNSLEKICFDLLTEAFIPEEDDLILIGLPPPGRYLYFRENRVESLNPGHLGVLGWSELDLDTMSNFYSDPKILWDFIVQLSLLEQYQKTVHPQLKIIPQWHDLKKLKEMFDIADVFRLNEVLDKLIDSELFLFNDGKLMNKVPIKQLEFGHPNRSTQLRMAKFLQRNFFKPI